MSDLKSLIEEQGKAFAEFKEANDSRLQEIEAKGTADPLLEEKVNKANEALTNVGERIEKTRKDLEARVDELESLIERPSGGGKDVKDAESARAFFRMVSGVEDGDLQAYREYRRGLNAYFRRGSSVSPDVQNALSVGSDPDGGYWVTPDMSGRMVELIFESSPVRQVASVQTIGTDALMGFNDLEEASAGWVEEQGTRSETGTPGVGKWRIPVHEQYALPKTTQQVLDDAVVDVEGWLTGKVGRKFGRQEAGAFITADGVGKPRGFLTYPAGTPSSSTWNVIEQTNTGASGAFAGTDPGDVFHTVIGKTKAEYLDRAVWMMNRTTLAAVRKLKDGDGTYLWEKSFQADQPFQLLGYPVVRAEDMPTIAADSLSIAFGDFTEGYQVVDRQGVRVLRDPYTTKGFVKFYTTRRVGGDVVNFEAIKLVKFAA